MGKIRTNAGLSGLVLGLGGFFGLAFDLVVCELKEGVNMKKLGLCAILALSSAAFAAGDAGCGLGGMLLTKQSKVSQTLALTTNSFLFNQLFGITSGTSGCSSSAIVKNKEEAIKFATENFDNLKIDLARGEGENLKALANLMGCQTKTFAEFSQQNFKTLLPAQSTPTQFIEALDGKIQSDAALRAGCITTT